jgi:hypothetical protein
MTADTFIAHASGLVQPVPDLDDTAEFSPYPPAPLTLADFQERVARWRKAKIPNATLAGQLDKLDDEAKELRNQIPPPDWIINPAELPGILNELCDVIIVGCNVADLAGISLAELLDAKQTKNEQRTWKADSTGKAQHVKET